MAAIEEHDTTALPRSCVEISLRDAATPTKGPSSATAQEDYKMASLFKELKPLVNATFEASQTISRTAPILAWTQGLMIVLLAAIFVALFGLLVTLNPDLEVERQQLITPAVRFLLVQIVRCRNITKRIFRKPTWNAKEGELSGAARESVAASAKEYSSGKNTNKKSL